MKVALTFPGCHRRGGVERVMFECARFLAGRGHDVMAFANDWGGSNGLGPDVKQRTVPLAVRGSAPGLLDFAIRSRRAVRKERPPFDVAGTFGVQCPGDGVMWVQSVHRAWVNISARERPLSQRLKQLCNPFHPAVLALERHHFAGRRYRKLIALTDAVKADLMELYRVPDDDVAVLPNGFSAEEFNPERRARRREEMRAGLGYPDRTRVVVFVANELERKGFGPLLRAIASLGDPDIALLAVGRLNAHAYAGEIASLGMSGRVRFTGPTSEVADYYAAADVFALPTQYEAWGLVIVEAMASGLPVLTSRLAGAAIAVEEGASGALLDDPRDLQEIARKLAPLIDGRHSPGSAIAQSVSRYRWSEVLLEYEKILESCCR